MILATWKKRWACLALAALLAFVAAPDFACFAPESFAAAEAGQAEATTPPLRRVLEIAFSVRPAFMVVPGEATLSFTITNISGYDAQNVYLISSDGLHSEPIGQIAAGDTQVFNRAYAVSEAELEAGEISFIISHDGVNGSAEQVNYTVSTPIERSIAAPKAEFTSQLSSDCVREGGTVTVTYRVRNTGNVPLSQLRVSDPLGDFIGRVEALEVGEMRVFTSKVTVSEPVQTEPKLSYSVAAEGGRTYESELVARGIFIADPELSATFAMDRDSAREGESVTATLMLRNLGNADYRDIIVRDAINGGVVASSLELPAGAEPLVVTHAYPVRGAAEYQMRIEAVCQTGERVSLETERLALSVPEQEDPGTVDVSAEARTPKIRRAGDVTFDVWISSDAAVGVRNVRLSEQVRGEIRDFAIVPGGGATHCEVTYAVQEAEEFTFMAEWTDDEGAHIVRALPVSVQIDPSGVLPEGAGREGAGLFQGGSVRMGESSIYLFLIFGGCVVLVGLILALWITSRKERRTRREREAQKRQQKKEDLGRTNRFVPVKRPGAKRDKAPRKGDDAEG